jgi:hypothetical protein
MVLRARLGAGIILAAVALFTVHFFLRPYPHPVAVGGAGLLVVVALAFRAWQAAQVALLLLLIPALARVWPVQWPLWLLGPLALWGMMVAPLRPLRRTVGWLRVGRLSGSVWALVGATVLASGLALWLWFLLAGSDLERWRRLVPQWSLAALVAGGCAFALLNAAMEETVWRGVVMDGLDSAFGPGHTSVVAQAISFGVVHMEGMPSGWLGVAMAMVYGVMLGYLRRWSGGLLAPFVAHVLADMIIFAIVVWVLTARTLPIRFH